MFLAFVLPSVVAWISLGFPVDKTSLALLGSSFIGGIISYIKEALGSTSLSKIGQGLSDRTQAELMLLAFLLPAVVSWVGLGFPTDKTSLALLGSALLGGVIAFIKDALGTSAPQTQAQTQSTPAPPKS
jgi:hypothetical protein